MTASNANGVVDVAQFPGRTVTLEMSAAQLSFIRALLFEDLQEWDRLALEDCLAGLRLRAPSGPRSLVESR